MQRSETTSMTWLLTTIPSHFGALWNLCVKGLTISFHLMLTALPSQMISALLKVWMTFSPLCLHQRTAITSPNLNMSPIVNFQTFFATQRKSPGPDSLPPRILKECASILSSPLCFFFNKSFSTGKLPHLWKLANITPVSYTHLTLPTKRIV